MPGYGQTPPGLGTLPWGPDQVAQPAAQPGPGNYRPAWYQLGPLQSWDAATRAVPGQPTYSRVHAAPLWSASNKTGGTLPVTVAPVNVGDLMVVSVLNQAATQVSSLSGGGVPSSGPGAWQRVGSPWTDPEATPSILEFWWGVVNATGSQTLTVTFAASTGTAFREVTAQDFHASQSGVWQNPGGLMPNLTNASSGTVTYPAVNATPYQAATGLTTGAGTSRTAAVGTATGTGDTLLALVTTQALACTISALTDSQGNQYVLDGSATGAVPVSYWFRSPGATGGPGGGPTAALGTTDTLTATSAAQTGNVQIQLTAVPGAGAVDQITAVASGASTAPAQTFTPAQDNEMCVALLASANGGGAPAITAPFAQVASYHSGVNPYNTAAWEALGTGTRSSQSFGATITSAQWYALVYTFAVPERIFCGYASSPSAISTSAPMAGYTAGLTNGNDCFILGTAYPSGNVQPTHGVSLSEATWAVAACWSLTPTVAGPVAGTAALVGADGTLTAGSTLALAGAAALSGSGSLTAAGAVPSTAPYVAGTLSSNTATTSFSVPITTAMGTGDGLLLGSSEAGAGVMSNVTDSQGNQWALQKQTATTPSICVWGITGGPSGGAIVPLGLTDTLSVTFSVSDTVYKEFLAVGVPGQATLDTAGEGGPVTGSTATPSVTSGTLAAAGEMVVAFFATGNAGGTPTVTAPATIIGATVHGGASTYLTGAYLLAASTSAVTLAGAITSTSWRAVAVPLSAAAAPVSGAASLSGGSGSLTSGGGIQGAASLAGSGTLTSGPAVLVPGAAALAGTGTLTSAGGVQGAATLSGLGALTAPAALGAPTVLSGSGTLTAAGGVQGAASLSGSGALTAAATVRVPGAAALSGSGTLTAPGGVQGAAALSGSGTLTSAATVRVPGAAALTGSGTLTAAGGLQGAVTLSGAGSLSAPATQGAAASLTGSGALTAAGGVAGAASLNGSGALTAPAGQGAPTTLSGSGTLTAAGGITGAAALSGTGTLVAATAGIGAATLTGGAGLLTAPVALPGAAALAGTGTLTAAGGPAGAAALSGAGTLTAPATLPAGAALAGSGTLTAAGGIQGSAALSGSGTLTAPARQGAAAGLAGSGTLAAGGGVQGAAALNGFGALGAPAQLGASAALSGTGTLSAAPLGAGGAQLAGAGSLTAPATQGAAAALSGQGTLAAGATLGAAAALSGAGALTAPVALAGAATLAGTGSLSATPTAGAGASLSGTGALTAPARLGAGATLAGTGALTAAASGALPGAAALAGAGVLTAAGGITAAAALGGSGTLTSGAVVGARGAVTLTGGGVLLAGVTLRSTVLLAGAGQLVAAGVMQPLFAILESLKAGPPRLQWAAGMAHDGYAAGAPRGQWSAGRPRTDLPGAGPPHGGWSAEEARP